MVSLHHVSGIVVILTATLVIYLDSCSCMESVRKLANANNEMTLKIIQQLAGKKENVIFSPLSLSSVFAMLYHGVKNKTAEEMEVSLGYKKAHLSKKQVTESFQKYLSEISDVDDNVFKLFNAVLLDKKFDMVPSYKTDVQKMFQATVEHIDIKNESKKVMEKINGWVKKKTQGKIEKLLDDLDPSTVLVLLNAVYFKGTWKTQFDPKNTKEEIFYQNGIKDNKKKVPMMRLTDFKLRYAQVDDFQVFELPYKGGDLSMMVLLPQSKNGLSKAIKNLKLEKLDHIGKNLSETTVQLTMPKFKLEYKKEMSKIFQELGMKSVFQKGADFSGLTKDDGVFVNEVMHKAVIEVNEKGTEAAAATGTTVVRSANKKIVVDHPFLFTIVDKKNYMILLAGCVTQL